MTTKDNAPEGAIEKPKVERKFAKQAVAAAPIVSDDPEVSVRVLKAGADKISTGTHVKDLGDELYAAGEVFDIAKSIADDLEARGYVETQ